MTALEASFDRIESKMKTLLRLTFINASLILALVIKTFFFWP